MTAVRAVARDALLGHGTALRSVYADAFCAPPWNEDEERADAFVTRLGSDVRRPGFTAALAFDGPDVVGFATAWSTPTPSRPTAATRRRPPVWARAVPRSGCAGPGRSTSSPSVPPLAAPGSRPASCER